jgi:hypothetical protein
MMSHEPEVEDSLPTLEELTNRISKAIDQLYALKLPTHKLYGSIQRINNELGAIEYSLDTLAKKKLDAPKANAEVTIETPSDLETGEEMDDETFCCLLLDLEDARRLGLTDGSNVEITLVKINRLKTPAPKTGTKTV